MIYVINDGERIFPELQSSPCTSIFNIARGQLIQRSPEVYINL